MIKSITSRINPEIQAIAKLSTTKERHTQKKFIAEGIRTIETILMAGLKPHMIYATHEWLSVLEELSIASKNITQVSTGVMNKLSQARTPSGILGVFPIIYGTIKKIDKAGIVLVRMQDPGNVGTLMRTCAAMNKKIFVSIEGVDPWHPKVVQASAGTIACLIIIQCTWSELIAHKKLPLGALVVKGGKSIKTISENILLVIGGEAFGIPEHWLNECEYSYTLTMPGNTESLNAAVAGSIAMYIIWSTQS